MNALVQADYNELSVSFTEEAWINATAVAERFGKSPNEWLRLPSTDDYIHALERKYGKIPHLKPGTATGYVKTKRGNNGGTWLHPKLAVRFAQWLDVDFAVWCDEQIDGLLRGKHPHYDWKRMRHEATSSFKVMNQILAMTRERLGKTCAAHHFSNEARLINWALTGAFAKLDREALAVGDLDLLAKLENLDTVLLGCGASYDQRKAELEQFASDQRTPKLQTLEAA
jgi:hypothetical protein